MCRSRWHLSQDAAALLAAYELSFIFGPDRLTEVAHVVPPVARSEPNLLKCESKFAGYLAWNTLEKVNT